MLEPTIKLCPWQANKNWITYFFFVSKIKLYISDIVTRCKLFCNLQRNPTLNRCYHEEYLIYEECVGQMQSKEDASLPIFSRVKLRCKLQEKLHLVAVHLIFVELTLLPLETKQRRTDYPRFCELLEYLVMYKGCRVMP